MSVGALDKALSSTICCQKNPDFEKNFFRALPSLHNFLRCDSTSAFYGIGKRKWLNIVTGNEVYWKALSLLGESLQIEDPLFDMIESMVCQAYGFLKSNVKMTFDMKNVAGINFLKLLNFHQPKTS